MGTSSTIRRQSSNTSTSTDTDEWSSKTIRKMRNSVSKQRSNLKKVCGRREMTTYSMQTICSNYKNNFKLVTDLINKKLYDAAYDHLISYSEQVNRAMKMEIQLSR